MVPKITLFRGSQLFSWGVELRGRVINDLTKYYETAAVNLGKRAEPEAIEMTDDLISAAHAEGVAEGFAEGVEDTTADLALVEDAETFARGRAEGIESALNMAQRWIDREWLASRHVISLPHDVLFQASLLAPTKEKEHE